MSVAVAFLGGLAGAALMLAIRRAWRFARDLGEIVFPSFVELRDPWLYRLGMWCLVAWGDRHPRVAGVYVHLAIHARAPDSQIAPALPLAPGRAELN